MYIGIQFFFFQKENPCSASVHCKYDVSVWCHWSTQTVAGTNVPHRPHREPCLDNCNGRRHHINLFAPFSKIFFNPVVFVAKTWFLSPWLRFHSIFFWELDFCFDPSVLPFFPAFLFRMNSLFQITLFLLLLPPERYLLPKLPDG